MFFNALKLYFRHPFNSRGSFAQVYTQGSRSTLGAVSAFSPGQMNPVTEEVSRAGRMASIGFLPE